ncbi:A disintegrin and metalloproteinase with thrombospondin motifs 16-like isoform X2 [Branchiostoma lanceolatum]|uniref:A disintegrin and metalloproteinase with thrombospondin motifs 16-like isoform X2 n=1 Tax=Branchiostoma lanceolatum TaxID=7740 RepID=UPI003454F451
MVAVLLYSVLGILAGVAAVQDPSQGKDRLEDAYDGTTLARHPQEFMHPEDFEIVAPHLLDVNGNFLAHDCHGRRPPGSTNQDQAFHVKLRGHGQDFHVELRPNHRLLAPGFAVHRRRNKATKVEKYDQSKHCHFHGTLLSHGNSSAAISTCDGLKGVLRTPDQDYFIEPLHPEMARRKNYTSPSGPHPHVPGSPHPHVLYKRSVSRPPKASKLRRHQRRGHRQHYCGRKKKYYPKPLEEPILLPDEFAHAERTKRSLYRLEKLNQEWNVETLVVVDKKMLEKHGNENITTYVLTILNMVSSLYKDGTIGSSINIVLVGLVMLDGEEDGLNINHHADQSLNSFCQWQSSLDIVNGTRHDHAILLTGLDICSWKNAPCDTLGFAPISGMCSKYRSCTINEDSGLGLAFTIAHESGHNFGMVHDGEGNVCSKRDGNIMSPTLQGVNGMFSWSSCSRNYLRKFLVTSQSTCLNDPPKAVAEFKFPEKLPGELYNADLQCKWQFGNSAQLCMFDFGKDICKGLWCHRGGRRCETKFLPAAEGTSCGPNKWCRMGQCVDYGADGPPAVDGGWSPFSEWAPCSRTCGGGITYKERDCNNPRPQYGGAYCVGESKIYRMCNIQDCPKETRDFRSQQCAEFNSKPFRGWYYKWKPYTRVEESDQCKLYCIAEDFDFFYALASKVKDGTRCVDEGDLLDVCVDGACEKVGCDHVLGSDATHDSCGVCNGDNSTCDFVYGEFHDMPEDNKYFPIVTIPVGARSVRVEELNISSSYLAVRDLDGKYYLTGDWTVDWPGEFEIDGTTFLYSRPYNQPEMLTAKGPTKKAVVVELLVQGENKGVAYTYTVPKPANETEKKPVPSYYTWSAVTSQCSASCGGGTLVTTAQCLWDLSRQVDDSFCDQTTKPSTGTHECNMDPCPPRWIAGEWGTCSKSCGGGKQARPVNCTRKTSTQEQEPVDPDGCKNQPKPYSEQNCNMQECPPQWVAGDWSECSKKCGHGFQTREVECKSMRQDQSYVIMPDSLCKYQMKPKIRQHCSKKCSRKMMWFISAWSQCSVSCGEGVRKRLLKCATKDSNGWYRQFPERRCSHLKRPPVQLEEKCVKPKCPKNRTQQSTPKWYTGKWSTCSKECGGGLQQRLVHCIDASRGSRANGCPAKSKPPTSRQCNLDPCPEDEESDSCQDAFRWCHLVPQHNVCDHSFYGQKCCKSCRKHKQEQAS